MRHLLRTATEVNKQAQLVCTESQNPTIFVNVIFRKQITLRGRVKVQHGPMPRNMCIRFPLLTRCCAAWAVAVYGQKRLSIKSA